MNVVIIDYGLGNVASLSSAIKEIRKYTLEVTQATTSQAKANEKIQPLREKEIEAAAKLNRINLERESLDHEEERIKEAKNNLERTIQQIIGDFEREQFQLKDASKDLEILNAKKNHTDNDQGIHEVDNEKIDSLKEEKDQLEVQIADLEKNIEQYNTIKNAKRDDWQRTIVSNENIMSKQSTLEEVEGYDDTSNWTKIFTDKF